jgi:Uma2 family endonuclease
MKLQTKTLTGEDLLNLPMGTGERYELIEGELIIMPPAGGEHGEIASTISGEIYLHLKKHKSGKIFAAETGFYTRRDNRTVRAPDVAFIQQSKIPQTGISKGFLDIVPDLIVEVVSPHDRASEIDMKVIEWLEFGVQLVWIVYPESRRIFVYEQEKPNPIILDENDTLIGGSVLPEFEVQVTTIFSD